MTRTGDSSRCRPTPRLFAIACGVALALHLQAAANAQEWRLEPEIRVGGEYDDNARLRAEPDQEFEIDGYILEGSAGIGYQTQRTTFMVTPRLRSRVYDEPIDVDSDDQFLDIDWDHEALRSRFSLDADYSRESVRTAERADADLDIEDPADIPTDATGIVLGNQRRTRVRIAPAWSRDLTERLALELGLVHIDTSYDEDAFGGLRDYKDTRVMAGLSRQLTQRTRGYIGASARSFESETGNDVEGVGITAGFETEISETTLLQGEVGAEQTDQEATSSDDTNFVGNLSLIRRLETVRLLAQYRRDVSAGGAGRVTERDTINFKADKQFTERVSGAIGVRAFQTNGLGDQVVTFEERDYAEFYADFEVALSRAFSFEAEYRHARLDRSSTEGSADSNSIILWLVYKPTPIVGSR